MPQNGREWDALISRCLSNARIDLIDQLRAILRGEIATEPQEDDLTLTTQWFEGSLARWEQVVARSSSDSLVRFPSGHLAIAYRLVGNLTRLSLTDLREALDRAQVPHTGWPEFSVPRRYENRPYIQDDNLECWIARDGEEHGLAHDDFWRASPDGYFFMIRGHQEDERTLPKTAFDTTLATWRVGEALLHAANMARELGDPSAQVTIIVEWTGLAGRMLTHLGGTRLMFDHYRALQENFRETI
jgi:transcriptional regulator with XRE-family HTH domain